MPEMHYTVRWPDASESRCYSPSLVIHDFFAPAEALSVAEFLRRIREATAIANERVHARYGFECSRANAELADIERRAARFAEPPGLLVHVGGFEPPAP